LSQLLSTSFAQQTPEIRLLLGIDQGSFAVKAVLFDAYAGPIVARAIRGRQRLPARAESASAAMRSLA
jgi:activator of 2-hydroxyglutaryl-CoA dehydratase